MEKKGWGQRLLDFLVVGIRYLQQEGRIFIIAVLRNKIETFEEQSHER